MKNANKNYKNRMGNEDDFANLSRILKLDDDDDDDDF